MKANSDSQHLFTHTNILKFPKWAATTQKSSYPLTAIIEDTPSTPTKLDERQRSHLTLQIGQYFSSSQMLSLSIFIKR